MQAIGFIIKKAPEGGYELSKLVGLDGQIVPEVIAFCTTLREVQEIEHAKKSEMFGERAWYPPAPSYVPIPAPNGHHDDGMPSVVEKLEKEVQSTGGWMRNGVRALVPLLVIASLYCVQLPMVRV